MITRRGAAKLMDFGIARIAHEQQLTMHDDEPSVTPEIHQPGAIGRLRLHRRPSDLYVLGLILYEMLVGEPYARRRRPLNTVRADLPPY